MPSPALASPQDDDRNGPAPARDVVIRAVGADEAERLVRVLADILIDCVEGGASVGFMLPLSRDRAEAFWQGAVAAIRRGERILFVAERGGDVLGTVQVEFAQKENQPHRGDLSKMLVRRRERRQGIGAALIRAAEAAAREAGRILLVLDTATGSPAERLYEGQGWTRVGVIADYAMWPEGGLCGTTVYYKRLA